MSTKTVQKPVDDDLDAMLGGPVSNAVNLEGDDFEDGPAEPQEVDFDFSASEDIKTGRYFGRVQEMWFETNSRSGNKQFVVKIFLPQAKRSLQKVLSMSPAAMGITGQNLRVLGFGPKDGQGSMGKINCREAVGRLLDVDAGMAARADYNGPEITKLYPPSEACIKLFAQLDNGG